MKDFFFSFNGRIGRTRFLLGSLAVSAFAFVMLLVGYLLALELGYSPKTEMPIAAALVLFATTFGTAVLAWWAQFALAVKRWHDLGHAGGWALLTLVPIVGWLAWCYAAIAPGDEFENVYGPQPA